MKLFAKAPDGGAGSGVTGFYLVEIKSLFSIVLLRFSKGSREAFHSHAFNAWTVWLRGEVRVREYFLPTSMFLRWRAGQIKFTPRNCFHKIEGGRTAWALTFRGPWADRWQESRRGRLVTLTHGRKEVR